jgi:hypothetical protein
LPNGREFEADTILAGIQHHLKCPTIGHLVTFTDTPAKERISSMSLKYHSAVALSRRAAAVAEESSAIGDKIASATERRRQITILVERAVESFRRSGRTGAAFVAP